MPTLRFDRRRAVSLVILGGGAALLAACQRAVTPVAPTAAPASAGAPAPAAPTAPAATVVPNIAAAAQPTAAPAGATPKAGGTLRQGYVGDLIGIEGHTRSGNDGLWYTFDRLTSYNDSFQPTPMLAESWEASADAKQLTLHLRKGVQFHTGREFTSDDVKYNIQRTADPKVAGGQLAPLASWWTAVETPDKYTAVLRSDLPRPNAFDYFENLNIVDKDVVESPDGKTKSSGTGPFAFVEWVQGDHVTLAKNKNYWQSGRPYLDEVRIPILRDQQAMVAQLEAGAIDMARGPSLRDFVRLRDDPGFGGLAHTNTGGFYVLGANTGLPPTDNKLVRQALSYAFDRQRFVDTVLLGIGKAESLPWPPGSAAFEESKVNQYPFDLDKARALLNQAGLGSGFSIDFWPYLATADYTGMGQIYQADLAKLGITLNLKQPDVATWLDQVNNAKYIGLYAGPAGLGDMSPATCFTSSKAFAPAGNNSAFKSDRYAELVTQASTEPDPAKLKPIYAELNDLFLDEAFTIVLSPTQPVLLTAKKVNGVTFTHHERVDLTNTWLA